MHIDAREVEPQRVVETDLCIIGAGAAGITLGLEFGGAPIRVCILESGGAEGADAETQDLCQVINIGRPYNAIDRLRFLGGCTNHWGGHCVPLRAINFERLPWSRYSGWPFSLDELEPYYRRAHEVIKIGPFDYNAQDLAHALGLSLFPFDPAKVQSVISRYHALRFGREYLPTLVKQQNVELYTNANVTSINRHRGGKYVESVSVRTLTGRGFSVRAKRFVLATGGIENARLLLLSNDVQRGGLGNQNDLVGRFFTEHIWYPSGIIVPAVDSAPLKIYGEEIVNDGVGFRAHVTLPQDVVRDLDIPDYRTEFSLINTYRFTGAVSSVRDIKRGMSEHKWPDDFAEDVRNIIANPDEVYKYLTSASGGPVVYRLDNHVEQSPNPDSRVSLSPTERDALGLNRATLDWRLSEIDREGIRRAQAAIAAEVGRSGFGRMQIQLKSEEPVILEGAEGGYHHMGTTRMHASPKLGVVDADCRIHGLQNMYVAGSSVFPTCGYPNPTLTIVALSIRLADHLKKSGSL